MTRNSRPVAVILIALLTVPSGVSADDTVARIPPAEFLRTANAREAAGAAQTLAELDTWALLQGLPAGSRVTLTLTSGQEVTGTVIEIEPDAVVMNSLDTDGKELYLPNSASRPGGAKAFRRTDVVGVQGPQRPRLRRAVILGTVLGAVAFMVAPLAMCASSCEVSGGSFAVFTAGGAGLGALVGLGVGLVRRLGRSESGSLK